MEIQGIAALVTGAGGGLGAETARALAEAGAKVSVLDLNGETAGKVAADIGGLAIQCDVTSPESAEAAIARAREAHGPARLLVNCAGIAPPKRIVGRDGPQDLADFSKIIQVNLIGTFNMMRLAAADMLALDPVNEDGERGLIVNTASVAAYEGQIGQAAYAASKGGVVALSLPAAREFSSKGVRVNAIAPGTFATPMLLEVIPLDVQETLAASVPFPKRLGNPREYADLVLFMAKTVMMNGECVRLDGAIRMQPK